MGNKSTSAAAAARGDVHVCLLGDSSFDNGNWTDGPCVTDQVRSHFPRTTRCARDGALIAALHEQAKQIPADATHVIVSVGGNDATTAVNIVKQPAADGEHAILAVWKFVKSWEAELASTLEALRQRLRKGARVVVCSVYSPCFGPFGVSTVSQDTADAFIALVADATLRVATRLGMPVIDWRRVMNQVRDFANPIEPSSAGGQKMADVIADVVRGHPFRLGATVVYPQAFPVTELLANPEGDPVPRFSGVFHDDSASVGARPQEVGSAADAPGAGGAPGAVAAAPGAGGAPGAVAAAPAAPAEGTTREKQQKHQQQLLLLQRQQEPATNVLDVPANAAVVADIRRSGASGAGGTGGAATPAPARNMAEAGANGVASDGAGVGGVLSGSSAAAAR